MEKLFDFITGILMFNGFIYFMKKASKKEFNKKRKLRYFIIGYCFVYAVLVYILPPEFTSLITFLTVIFAYKLFTKISNKDLIFYTIVQWAIGIVLDILIMSLTNAILKINNLDTKLCRIIGSLFIALTYFVIGKNKYIIDFINNIKKYLYNVNYSIYILAIFLIIYYYLGSFTLKHINNAFIPTMILFICISLLIILMLYIVQQIQIKSLKDNIKLLSRNNEFYIERIDEYRIMKHNLISNLNGIKSISNKKTIKLIDDLILKYKEILKMPKNFKNLPTGINGIIYEKIYNINDSSFNVSINNKIKNNVIEVLNARDYNNFCEALSVSLDNAIEAAKKSKEKILFLEITETENKLMLKVINSFNGVIDIDALGTKNYTSKHNGNGLGLFSILNIRSVKLTTLIKDNKYSCIIAVNKTT